MSVSAETKQNTRTSNLDSSVLVWQVFLFARSDNWFSVSPSCDYSRMLSFSSEHWGTQNKPLVSMLCVCCLRHAKSGLGRGVVWSVLFQWTPVYDNCSSQSDSRTPALILDLQMTLFDTFACSTLLLCVLLSGTRPKQQSEVLHDMWWIELPSFNYVFTCHHWIYSVGTPLWKPLCNIENVAFLWLHRVEKKTMSKIKSLYLTWNPTPWGLTPCTNWNSKATRLVVFVFGSRVSLPWTFTLTVDIFSQNLRETSVQEYHTPRGDHNYVSYSCLPNMFTSFWNDAIGAWSAWDFRVFLIFIPWQAGGFVPLNWVFHHGSKGCAKLAQECSVFLFLPLFSS